MRFEVAECQTKAVVTENLVKFGPAVFEICERTDTLIAILPIPTGGQSNK